jgi:hypothetical protein
MTHRPHQRVVLLVMFALTGFLALGAVLDSVSNALALVTFEVTLYGSAIILLLFVVLQAALSRRPLPWTVRGRTIYIKKIGVGPSFALLGCLVLLWTPRLVDVWRPADREAQRPKQNTRQIEQIEQRTSGANSPAVVAGGDVKIAVESEAKDTKEVKGEEAKR